MEFGDNSIVNIEMDALIKKIEDSKFSKVILTGEKKCGKTELLKYYSKKYNNDRKRIIYVDFKDFNYKRTLSDKEYGFYCELVFVKKMLEGIDVYNHDIYNSFKMYEHYINTEFKKFKDYLMTRYYANSDIEYEKGSIVNRLLEIFNMLGIDNVNLVIDHFDFVGESSEKFQLFMKDYFDMFNKVIITTNEEIKEDKKERLSHEYGIIDVDYASNIEVVKRIIKEYISELDDGYVYDINHLLKLHKVYIISKDDEFYIKLMNKCGNNLDMMIEVVRNMMVDDEIDNAIKSVVNMQNKMNNLTYKRILHL